MEKTAAEAMKWAIVVNCVRERVSGIRIPIVDSETYVCLYLLI